MSDAPPAAGRNVVHVVDDDQALRNAVGRLLRHAGYEPRLYASAEEYLAAPELAAPACVLIDLRMPGCSGLSLQEALSKRGNAHPVIFLTGHGDIRSTVQAMLGGAIDFLTKPVKAEQLLPAIALAIEKDLERRSRREYLAGVRARYETLTPRERQVMSGVIVGLLNKQIGYVLHSAERTVKTHRSRVMEKMQAHSVPELVRFAEELREAGIAIQEFPRP
jgi:FixJ family two-component response regulator